MGKIEMFEYNFNLIPYISIFPFPYILHTIPYGQ